MTWLNYGLTLCTVIALHQAEAAFRFRAPATPVTEHVPGLLLVEAEHFSDYGEWRLDTQFTHKMGSAYLIAPGVGDPIGAARTTVSVTKGGLYRVWARTKDWLPEHSPGRFRIDVGGKQGRELGVSGKPGWRWETCGDFTLSAGSVELSLVDLSGAFARCDAVILSSDLVYVPPDGGDALVRERRRLTGGKEEIADGGEYDVVVVGAGTAGCGAALAAARTGARTVLVHDRPVMGGNSSSELGIGTDGAAGAHPNRNLFARETGLCEEMNLTKKYTKTRSASDAYQLLADLVTNLVVAGNERVMRAEKRGEAISSVIARNTLTGERTRYRAKIFIDATGDGWVGRFAGADLMHGREAKDEFAEEQAPEKRDALIMSGCLMDGYLSYRWQATGRPVAYRPPAWAKQLPEGFTRRIADVRPTWWIEHHGRFDELEDPEGARDELIRIVFAYWGWVKNVWKGPGSEDAALVAVPHMNGRREGYRITGDYVLTANDCLAGRVFPDRVTYGGWPLDTHDPLGIENPTGNGYWQHHPGVPIYTIPFRCLYSRNVPNLMMAGRDISVTHIAMGSVRVEATCFTLGQAAGTAAALAVKAGLSPRDYGKRHIAELQQRLVKDDMYIPGVKNEDPLDLARQATSVTATSLATSSVYDEKDRFLLERGHGGHSMDHDRAVGFDRRNLTEIRKVRLHLGNRGDAPVKVPVRVYSSRVAGNGPVAEDLVAETEAVVPPGKPAFVTFTFAQPARLSKDYVWISVRRTKGVTWTRRVTPFGTDNRRAYGHAHRWTLRSGDAYAFLTEPALADRVDTKPEYVIDGSARSIGGCSHGWISDPDAKLPQALTLSFEKPVTADELRLTFDTDLTPPYPAAYPRTLVRAYSVEGQVNGTWRTLVDEPENGLRQRVHAFETIPLSAVRVTVRGTWGDRSARIQEVRLYQTGKDRLPSVDPRVDRHEPKRPCEAAAIEKAVAATPDGGVCQLPSRSVYIARPIAVSARRNLTIRGGDKTVLTLHFTPFGTAGECTGGFVFRDCDGLVVEKLRVTTDVPVNASGRVVAKNPKAGTYDVRIESAFPMTGAEHLVGLNTFDEEGAPDYTIETYNDKGMPIQYEVIAPQLLRVKGPSAAKIAALKPSHRVLYRYLIYGSTVFSVIGCRDTVFRDVEIERCASFGMCVSPPSRNLTLERFNMRPPAGDPALFCANADGVHVLGLAGKLTMRDCRFRGLGDDALNVHGKAGEIKAYDPQSGAFAFICRTTSRMETRLPRGWAEKGSRIVVYDAKTFLEKGHVFLTSYDPTTGRGVLTAGATEVRVGDLIANDRDFAEVDISDCSVENTRARGFLLQSRKLRVADCRFSGLSLPALLIATDFVFWNECGPTCDCEIRNCSFDKCAMVDSPVNRGAVVVKVNHDTSFDGYPAGVHRNVRVIGNRFTRCRSGAACIAATDGVTATGNSSAGGDKDFTVVNCDNVRITDNRVFGGK